MRYASLTQCLPLLLQHNASTLYHLALDGVDLSWPCLTPHLTPLVHLHHLHLTHCHLTDTAAHLLLSSLTPSTLTHLSLAHNRLTDAVVAPLAPSSPAMGSAGRCGSGRRG